MGYYAGWADAQPSGEGMTRPTSQLPQSVLLRCEAIQMALNDRRNILSKCCRALVTSQLLYASETGLQRMKTSSCCTSAAQTCWYAERSAGADM